MRYKVKILNNVYNTYTGRNKKCKNTNYLSQINQF